MHKYAQIQIHIQVRLHYSHLHYSFCRFFQIFPFFFKQIYQMDKQQIEMSRTRQAKRGNFEQCNNLGIKARLNILSTQRSKVKHTILNIITLKVKAI